MENEKVLVVAVHPDDETLGCGGTLLKHKFDGDTIAWCIVTAMKEEKGFSKQAIRKREEEIKRVENEYSFDDVFQLNYPTVCLDEFSKAELIGEISKAFLKYKPTTLYLPFKNDVHSDHRIVFEAIFSCTKSFRYSFIKKIYMMETLSETEFAPSIPSESFVPNYFVDISNYFEKKKEILSIFEDEIGVHPFPRSLKNLEALATLRGAMSNCKYAESFMLLKEIN